MDNLSRFTDIFKDDTAPIKFAVLLVVLLVGILLGKTFDIKKIIIFVAAGSILFLFVIVPNRVTEWADSGPFDSPKVVADSITQTTSTPTECITVPSRARIDLCRVRVKKAVNCSLGTTDTNWELHFPNNNSSTSFCYWGVIRPAGGERCHMELNYSYYLREPRPGLLSSVRTWIGFPLEVVEPETCAVTKVQQQR